MAGTISSGLVERGETERLEERHRGVVGVDELAEHEHGLRLHRPADPDLLVLLDELLEIGHRGRDRDERRAVEHEPRRAVVGVLGDEDDRPAEVRVEQRRRGDEKMSAERLHRARLCLQRAAQQDARVQGEQAGGEASERVRERDREMPGRGRAVDLEDVRRERRVGAEEADRRRGLEPERHAETVREEPDERPERERAAHVDDERPPRERVSPVAVDEALEQMTGRGASAPAAAMTRVVRMRGSFSSQEPSAVGGSFGEPHRRALKAPPEI